MLIFTHPMPNTHRRYTIYLLTFNAKTLKKSNWKNARQLLRMIAHYKSSYGSTKQIKTNSNAIFMFIFLWKEKSNFNYCIRIGVRVCVWERVIEQAALQNAFVECFVDLDWNIKQQFQAWLKNHLLWNETRSLITQSGMKSSWSRQSKPLLVLPNSNSRSKLKAIKSINNDDTQF